MNKRKLQDFASWAKLNLERQIELSLKKIGINSDSDIKRSRVVGEVTIVDGIETTFKKQFHHQREEIINHIKDDGFKHSIEQFASTWFNRIIALRFLEVHDYLDHGYKLFPKEPNTLPEILSKLSLVKDELGLDMAYIGSLTSAGNHNEELYRYVLFQQCSALGKALPMLFSSGLNYLEHFIPTPLLFGDTIINKLIEIDEEDFKEDVEIIGWLYQFYVASKKDEVFASKAKITKDTLPAVTQLFTPDWIVKYMAENSIGRIWLESFPSSPLKYDMKYYVDEAEQDPEVEAKLKLIRYQNVNPEEIKIIEPCSGSGHILVYCFDLLLKMYQEKGYAKKDIPSLILKNNLVGFDIDQRATQLASFALVMRARSIDNKFFDEGRYVRPKVYEIIDSKALAHCDYNGKSYKEIISDYNAKQWIGENQLTVDELKAIDYLVNLFDDAKVIGSLLKVTPGKYLTIRKKLATNVKENPVLDVFTSPFFDYEFKDLLEILRVAYFMSQKYDVMITNPPYMGISGIESGPKAYLSKNYPDSKTDMFAMFMETSFIKKYGYFAMINMHSWMFLKSYQTLRTKLISNITTFSMIHLGTRAFEEIGGEVVQTTSFVMRYVSLPDYDGKFYRLVDSKNKEKDFLEGSQKHIFINNENKFLKIPNNSFAYWASDQILDVFAFSKRIEDISEPRQGLATTDNGKYLRLWYELNFKSIKFDSLDVADAKASGYKWFPYNKGGSYRKWYGNYDYVVNYENDGKEIKQDVLKKYQYLKTPDFVVKNTNYYFRESITWPLINANEFSVRFRNNGSIHDVSGMSSFSKKRFILYYSMGILNTNIASVLFKILNPTINLQVGDFNNFPIKFSDEATNQRAVEIVKENISLTKLDWDSFETSWDFMKHPLLQPGQLHMIFTNYKNMTKTIFDSIKANEERLNQHFIELYSLQQEVTPFVNDASISISIADKERDTKSLISYLVGVLMGRYSLSKEGLIFAGGNFDPSRYGGHDVDGDGIIPIYSDISIEDGLVHRVIDLIKDVYGPENYRDNISFIAEALGKKSNETSEETLNRYLNDGFYQDHLKIYQKRPIYWMFSSGKLSGFKCLIYMHRYNQDTLAKINAGYFQPATTILRNQIGEIERQMAIVGDSEKRILDKKRLTLVEQLNEAREYGQVLDYMANKYLSIDLDDGVKVNYAKFQGIEVTTNNGKVKKDLLVPIK